MLNNVTEIQVSFYRDNGYLMIDRFLDEFELAQYRRHFDEAVKNRLEDNVEFLTNQRDPNHYFARVFIQCLNLFKTHEGMRSLVLDKKIGEMASMLSGSDGMRLWHDQVLIKPPAGNPTPWHFDASYWSFDASEALSCWIALDDATFSNGCMAYLPGTHKTADIDKNVRGVMNVGELFNHYPDWADINPRIVQCRAGTLIWHHGMTAHAAGANLTNEPRRAMTCIYMPDGVRFNGKRNAVVADYFDDLEVGDVLNNNRHHPLVFGGIREQFS